MKYLFINSVAGCGSTGKIAADQCRSLQKRGHECVLAYGRRAYACDDIKTVRIGTNYDNYVHGLLTRLFDLHGLGLSSYHATKKFLTWIDRYDPDVVWLHNLHGYYIHIGLLFDWMKRHPEKEYHWTLHDCWAFTGHCTHFTAVNCVQWKQYCTDCSQLYRYPRCFWGGRVKKNYQEKKATFAGIKNMTLRTPSKWLAGLVKESFLQEYPLEVVYNEIDKNVFRPTVNDFREKYDLNEKTIILSVANIWDERKGLTDLIKLAYMLNDNCVMIWVGLREKQIDSLSKEFISGRREKNNGHAPLKKIISQVVDRYPECIYEAIMGEKYNDNGIGVGPCRVIMIERTDSLQMLAGLYTVADVFVNPTHEDNYPTVNLEAIACGTPVITYDVGGAKETLY